jgi:putative DNA-invertase from lambdoid prophage Rac
MKTYAYLRVSTSDQDHGVDAQRAAILKGVGEVDEWFEERASGKDTKGRPVFTELIDRICAERATLVVSKLDRLGRSTLDVLGVFERVADCGANIRVLDMGLDTSTPMGKFMLTVLLGFAELEREMIRQRTKDGLAAARDKGVKLGRPQSINRAEVFGLLDAGYTYSQVAQHLDCSVRTVARIASEFVAGP